MKKKERFMDRFRFTKWWLYSTIAAFPVSHASANSISHFWIAPTANVFAVDHGTIENGIFQSDTYVDGTVASTEQSYVETSDLPQFDQPIDLGLELGVGISNGYAFSAGGSRWEQSSSISVPVSFPLQGSLNDAVYSREGSLRFDDLYVGLGINLPAVFSATTFQLRLSAHRISGIHYKEHYSWQVVGGAATGQSRYAQTVSKGESAYLPEVGLSVIHVFNRWLSAGFDVGYLYDDNGTRLGYPELSTDFSTGDQLSVHLPSGPFDSSSAGFRSGNRDTIEQLVADFSGFRAALKVVIDLNVAKR